MTLDFRQLVTFILIIALVFVASFCAAIESADASVLVPALVGACAGIEAGPALLLGATILTAAGVVFSTGTADEVIQTAAANLINNNPGLNAFVAEMVAAGSVASLVLTDEVCAELASWLDGVFSAESGTVELPESYSSICGFDFSWCSSVPSAYFDSSFSGSSYDFSKSKYQFVNSFPSSDFVFYNQSVKRFIKLVVSDGHYSYYEWNGSVYNRVGTTSFDNVALVPRSDGSVDIALSYFLNSKYWVSTYNLVPADGVITFPSNYAFPPEYTGSDSVSISSAVSAAADATYFPQSTDEEKKLAPGIPLTVPSSISDLVDMPMDQIRGSTADPDLPIEGEVDTSGTITGDGTGSGVFEGSGSWALNIPILGTIVSTLTSILDAIKSFFDVSEFSLSFDSLKVGLTDVFPFCIPFDFFRAVQMFSASASDFSFDIQLETSYFNIDHTVDLTPFRLPILFFRYIVVFWFGYILVSRTRDWIKW